MLSVLAVPAFQDNYLWLIHDGTHAAVVDPGDATPILDALARLNLSLAAILLTHHHPDHVGGVPELTRRFGVPVYGPRGEAIPGVTHLLGEGDQVTLARPAIRFEVLDVPGHTRGHIAYVAKESNWLFCGDTLFAGGCGRLFEGTPLQMADSLAKLAALPDTMQVYCAHEYTLSNLRFACAVEPGNQALQARMLTEQDKRDRGLATVPSLIGLEKETNPFLRCTQSEIVTNVNNRQGSQLAGPVEVFAALREWKNSFR